MKTKSGLAIIAALACLHLFGGKALASDLDDGISHNTDDSIEKDDELGQKDRNISFIKEHAKSQANVDVTRGINNNLSGVNNQSSGNMNSVVLGPGGSVRGDIIIIDESKGSKTQVVQ